MKKKNPIFSFFSSFQGRKKAENWLKKRWTEKVLKKG